MEWESNSQLLRFESHAIALREPQLFLKVFLNIAYYCYELQIDYITNLGHFDRKYRERNLSYQFSFKFILFRDLSLHCSPKKQKISS